MNPVIEFYATIEEYLAHITEKTMGNNSYQRKIIVLAEKCGKKISTEVTKDSLTLLWKSFHQDNRILSEVAGSYSIRQKFLTNAFKDLSIIKNPLAMKVFNRLTFRFFHNDVFLFAPKIIKLGELGAVIVLHTSSLMRVLSLLKTEEDTLKIGTTFE